MRSLWHRGITLGASALLALSMLVINFAYEAAGSVPDLPASGFLAGSLLTLTLVYPLTAGFVAARVLGAAALRLPPGELSLPRWGGRIGALGSALYFGAGMALTLCSPQRSDLGLATPMVACLYVLLCGIGGWLGGLVALQRRAGSYMSTGSGWGA